MGLYDINYPVGSDAIDIVWGTSINLTSGESLVYNGWPWGMAKYDSTRDRVILGYTTGSVHNEDGDPAVQFDKEPRFIYKANASTEDMSAGTNTFSSPVSMYPATEDTSCMSQALAVTDSGNYVAITGFAVYPNWFDNNETAALCTSTDGGATWNNTTLQSSAGGIGSSYPCGLFKTSSGRLIHCNSFDMDSELWDHKPRMIYTDTGGNPWTISHELNRSLWQIDSATNKWIWEPEFYETRDGVIVSVWRSNRSVAATQTPFLYSTSTDDGATWSPLKETNLKANANPIGMAALPDGRVLAIVGSRQTGGAGLFASITTEENLKRGIFGEQKKLIDGLSTNTWGYPAVVTVGNRIWVYYYTGNDTRSDVWELRGMIQ